MADGDGEADAAGLLNDIGKTLGIEVKSPEVKPDEKPPASPPPPEEKSPEVKPDEKPPETPEVPESLFEPPAPSEVKPDEKPPKHVPADEEKLEAALPAKARQAFASMRQQMRSLETELAAAKKAPVVQPAEVDALKQQLADVQKQLEAAHDRIGMYDLAADPRFQQKYAGPQRRLAALVAQTVKEFEVEKPEELVGRLVRMSGKARVEALQAVAPEAVAAVIPVLAQFDVLEAEKRAELASHKTVAERMQKEAASQSLAQAQQGKEVLLKASLDQALAEGEFVFLRVAGNEAWNKGVEAAELRVKEVFAKDDPREQAMAIVRGVAAPVYRRLLMAERAKRIALEAELGRRRGTRPRIESSGTPPAPGAKPRPETMTGIEAGDRALASIGKNG